MKYELKMFLTLLIGSIVGGLVSLWRQDAAVGIIFLTGCLFGRFSTLDHLHNEKTK